MTGLEETVRKWKEFANEVAKEIDVTQWETEWANNHKTLMAMAMAREIERLELECYRKYRKNEEKLGECLNKVWASFRDYDIESLINQSKNIDPRIKAFLELGDGDATGEGSK